jgi:hypothetical protein
MYNAIEQVITDCTKSKVKEIDLLKFIDTLTLKHPVSQSAIMKRLTLLEKIGKVSVKKDKIIVIGALE